MIIYLLMNIACSTLFAYIFGCLGGGMGRTSAVFALFLGWLLARILKNSMTRGFEDVTPFKFNPGVNGWIERALVVFILFTAYRHFGWLLYLTSGEYRTLSRYNFGDLPLHINYIRFLATTAHFPPLNPIFPTEPLRYPFAMDLYNAIWELLGVATTGHLFIVGIFATLASIAALRAWGGWIALGGFFFNGGLIGFEALRGAAFNPQIEDGLSWKSLFLTVFITQRGILFAIPAGTLLLLYITRLLKGEVRASQRQAAGYGLLWGILPFFHLHAFFIVTILMFGYCAIYFANAKRLLQPLITFAAFAFPCGTYFTLYSTGFFQKASVAHWSLGWTSGTTSFRNFAIMNFGLWPLFFVAALILLLISRDRKRVYEWCLAAALLVLFFNLMLAPWAWDNIKIIIWPYIVLLGVANAALARAPKNSEPIIVSVAFIMLFSGGTMMYRSIANIHTSIAIGNIDSISKAEGALKTVSPDAVLASASVHDSVLAWLGRVRALGYEGHLWSHAIDSRRLTAYHMELVRGGPNWKEAARALHATHVFWGPQEVTAYGPIPDVLKKDLPNLSPVPGYEVYALPLQ